MKGLHLLMETSLAGVGLCWIAAFLVLPKADSLYETVLVVLVLLFTCGVLASFAAFAAVGMDL